MRLRADRLIRRRGQPVVLREDRAGQVLNKATGAVTTPPTPVNHAGYAVASPVRRRRRGDAEAETTKLVGYVLSAIKDDGSVMPEPSPAAHVLVVGGVEYEIADVTPTAPGGIPVIYQLQVGL